MVKRDKENVGQQTTLNFIPEAKVDNRKYKLPVEGTEFDLNDPNLPVTREVIEAMRRRIIELEDALENQPPAKRRKIQTVPEERPSEASSTKPTDRMTAKTDAKKVDVLLKRFWTTLQKEVKTDKYKFRGEEPKVARIDEVIEEAEFDTIFEGKGVHIQPTSTNKPTSTIIIKEFSAENVRQLFGKHYKELKGNRYTRPGGGAKVVKLGPTELDINGMQVSYAKKTMKCTMKFVVEEASGPYCAPRSMGWYKVF